ncbi:MAG TPA: MFS transporter [Stellaceae bacterium]|nr:MFS transporter [Stellaceae bacterium]
MEPVTSSAQPLTASRKAHLGLAVLLVAIGFALLAPTRLDIVIILKEVMHGIGIASLGAAGLISTATLLGDGVFELIWGRLSDRWSRMGTLALGVALYSTFSILTATATTLPTLYLMRILLGIGQAMFIPAYFAFVGGVYGKRRGLLCGSLAGLFTIGVAVNPILTKDMFQATHQWQTPFIAYGAFGLALAAAIYLVGRGRSRIYDTRLHALPPPAVVHEASRTAWLFNRNMILLLITMMFWGLTQYGFLAILVTYLRTRQHFSFGMAVDVAAIGGWSSFAFSFVAGYLSDHIGRRRSLLIFGCVALVMAAPLFVLPQTFLSAAILTAIFQAANGTFYPIGVAYAQDFARAEHLGVHSGAVSGMGHLVAGIAGFVAGSIAGGYGYPALGWFFVAASVVMVVAIGFTQDPRPVLEPQLAPQPS